MKRKALAGPSPLARVKENEFLFLPIEEVGRIFGFGRDVMTVLVTAGAPVVGRKMNPWLLREWLRENHGKVPKVTKAAGKVAGRGTKVEGGGDA